MMSLLRQDTAEERISGLEVISKEFMKTEKQRDQRLKKKKKKKQNIQGLWDNYKKV